MALCTAGERWLCDSGRRKRPGPQSERQVAIQQGIPHSLCLGVGAVTHAFLWVGQHPL